MIFFGTRQLKSNCGQCFLIKCSLAQRNMRIMDHNVMEFIFKCIRKNPVQYKMKKKLGSYRTIDNVAANDIINVLYYTVYM